MEGLGRLFDVIPAATPVDLTTSGATGARLHLTHYGGVAIVFYRGTGTADDNPTISVREHDANTGGNSQDLAVVTHWYQKKASTLDGSQTWTEETESTATSDLTDTEWDDANESIAVVQVEATALSDGFEWISADIDDDVGSSQLGAVLYIPYDLAVQRDPAELADPNA